ncbi:ROK family protein [Pseudoflavitalea sp. X16]|uniref:ROK family protein n=1 Tax=Paraflavitalea devenefica TaxID=2716334 RepID=UPI0014248BCC|nr:ROK family protein [Paraflavitalea devenefica]NII24514.1 ROK family protein [Paraflavitalea devenefica]
MSSPLWGIDLGGTKIEGVILPSPHDARPLLRKRIDTEAGKGYPHIIGQIKRLIDMMQQESALTATRIGFGTPGELDPRLQTMKNCNSTALNGMPLKKDLEEALQAPVTLANDANCFALAETHWGVVKQQAPEARVVFGIIMGTGVGGGIVIDGQVWNGRHGIAGEWGHNFLDESGGPCYCGKTGCVEKVLSGPGLQAWYTHLTGQSLTLKEIVTAYKAGTDPAAAQTMERLSHFFGKAVSVVTNLLDPDVIVVGGGVGNIDVIYSTGVESLKKHIFNNGVDVPVLRPALGDSAGVFGAAALVAG